ncbi:MAG: PAS domain-containing protein [Flavobacteriales bacterium]|nr:PAS domain-containing protein [Flavobacteriales bacterium]
MKAPLGDVLQDEHDLLKKAIDSSICGVTIADARLPDMPLIFINEAFETLTGYKTSEVLGRNCRFLQGDLNDRPDQVYGRGVEFWSRPFRCQRNCGAARRRDFR